MFISTSGLMNLTIDINLLKAVCPGVYGISVRATQNCSSFTPLYSERRKNNVDIKFLGIRLKIALKLVI